MKSKPQKHRNLLFSCFVDFRKALDCIPRQKLSDKLRNEGANEATSRLSSVASLAIMIIIINNNNDNDNDNNNNNNNNNNNEGRGRIGGERKNAKSPIPFPLALLL